MILNYTLNFKDGHMIDLFSNSKDFEINKRNIIVNGKPVANTKTVDTVIAQDKGNHCHTYVCNDYLK